MLTQNHSVISSAVTLEHSHMGTQVFLGSTLLGTIEVYTVWGLDAGYDSALAQGLTASDQCYVAGNFPYRYLKSAVGAITGAYLTQAAIDTLLEYM